MYVLFRESIIFFPELVIDVTNSIFILSRRKKEKPVEYNPDESGKIQVSHLIIGLYNDEKYFKS
ncbi:hypothetical protein hrd7_23680 [Leptolinea sp. HRD-7]|nr:hypothetical protein hrd7_23680 [Leptolinea sp. HRD-7]